MTKKESVREYAQRRAAQSQDDVEARWPKLQDQPFCFTDRDLFHTGLQGLVAMLDRFVAQGTEMDLALYHRKRCNLHDFLAFGRSQRDSNGKPWVNCLQFDKLSARPTAHEIAAGWVLEATAECGAARKDSDCAAGSAEYQSAWMASRMLSTYKNPCNEMEGMIAKVRQHQTEMIVKANVMAKAMDKLNGFITQLEKINKKESKDVF